MATLTPPTYDFPRPDDVVTSQSGIEQMRLCPARRGYKGVDGYLGLTGRSAVQGIVVHDAMEELLAGGKVAEVLGAKRLRGKLEEVVANSGYKLTDLATEAKISNTVDRCRELAKALLRWWRRSGLTADTTEEHLYLPLDTLDDGRGLWVQGIIDLVAVDEEGHLVLVDWKTAGREWEDGKADSKIQMALYAAMLRHAGRPVHRAMYVVATPRKDGVVIEEHNVLLTPQTLDAAVADAAQWARMEAYRCFPHTPWPQVSVYDYQAKAPVTRRGWYCSPSYCPAWNICEGKYLDPTVGDEEAEVGW